MVTLFAEVTLRWAHRNAQQLCLLLGPTPVQCLDAPLRLFFTCFVSRPVRTMSVLQPQFSFHFYSRGLPLSTLHFRSVCVSCSEASLSWAASGWAGTPTRSAARRVLTGAHNPRRWRRLLRGVCLLAPTLLLVSGCFYSSARYCSCTLPFAVLLRCSISFGFLSLYSLSIFCRFGTVVTLGLYIPSQISEGLFQADM